MRSISVSMVHMYAHVHTSPISTRPSIDIIHAERRAAFSIKIPHALRALLFLRSKTRKHAHFSSSQAHAAALAANLGACLLGSFPPQLQIFLLKPLQPCPAHGAPRVAPREAPQESPHRTLNVGAKRVTDAECTAALLMSRSSAYLTFLGIHGLCG